MAAARRLAACSGCEPSYDTLRRYAMQQLGWGQKAPTVLDDALPLHSLVGEGLRVGGLVIGETLGVRRVEGSEGPLASDIYRLAEGQLVRVPV
ncbi:MAG: hypothetical protein ACLP1X_24410 [Polyangiaceae bacterium]